MAIIFNGTDLLAIAGATCCGYSIPAIKPVARPLIAIDPPLGDGKWLKNGQLDPGTVTVTISWLLPDNSVSGLSAAIAALCGAQHSLVTDWGTWTCVLEPPDNFAAQAVDGGTIATATLNFTIYP